MLQEWDIGLDPEIPLDLNINGNMGQNNFNLSELNLSNLVIKANVGQTELYLPPQQLDAEISGDVGDFKIFIPANADIEADIKGSVGGFTIEIEETVSEMEIFAIAVATTFVVDPVEIGLAIDTKGEVEYPTPPSEITIELIVPATETTAVAAAEIRVS